MGAVFSLLSPINTSFNTYQPFVVTLGEIFFDHQLQFVIIG
jgi:hypothetical protein